MPYSLCVSESGDATRAEIRRPGDAGEADALAAEVVDVTLPTTRQLLGRQHPSTLILHRFEDALVAMGYDIVDAPALAAVSSDANEEASRPALLSDVFDSKLIYGAPAWSRLFETVAERACPSYLATARRAISDSGSGSAGTYLIDALVVDQGITLSHLKGTLEHLLQTVSEEDHLRHLRDVRLLPARFLGTVPSAAVFVPCAQCAAVVDRNPSNDCPLCGSGGWVRAGGGGLLTSEILAMCGMEGAGYSGFAVSMDLGAMTPHGDQRSDLASPAM